MKKIMSTSLCATGTTTIDGKYCEWAWTESDEEEFGREWDGDVRGYVENLFDDYIDPDEYQISDDYNGSIHNLMPDCVIVVSNETNEPAWMYWAEDLTRDDYYELYEAADESDVITLIESDDESSGVRVANGVLCLYTDATADYYEDTPENREKYVEEMQSLLDEADEYDE